MEQQEINFPADKLYYTIGEVSKITGIKPHVLRYWETEFPKLAPIRTQGKGQGRRKYQKKDIELILRIKELLYNQSFTIEGAKKKLREKPDSSAIKEAEVNNKETQLREVLIQVKKELLKIREILESGRGAAW